MEKGNGINLEEKQNLGLLIKECICLMEKELTEAKLEDQKKSKKQNQKAKSVKKSKDAWNTTLKPILIHFKKDKTDVSWERIEFYA